MIAFSYWFFPSMNQKRNLKPLVVLASICASVATIFYFISKFIVKNFGEVTIPQILLNVRTAETSNSLLLDYIKIAVPYVIKCAILLFIIFYTAKLVNRFDTFGAFLTFLLKGTSKNNQGSKFSIPLF